MSQKLLNKFHFYATTLLAYSESEKVLIKVQITVNHVSNDAIEKVTEHSDNTPCLMIFKLKVIFSMLVGFNDASVLDDTFTAISMIWAG